MSNQIQAKAFTTGNHIYFNRGEYQPETSAGKRLLAHELTHTIQQGAVAEYAGTKSNGNSEVQRKCAACEQEEKVQRKCATCEKEDQVQRKCASCEKEEKSNENVLLVKKKSKSNENVRHVNKKKKYNINATVRVDMKMRSSNEAHTNFTRTTLNSAV